MEEGETIVLREMAGNSKVLFSERRGGEEDRIHSLVEIVRTLAVVYHSWSGGTVSGVLPPPQTGAIVCSSVSSNASNVASNTKLELVVVCDKPWKGSHGGHDQETKGFTLKYNV